ncbi:hypothetical protein AB0P19_06855 [Microbacterium oleivorans]|uniref:hypothetical protein n=1 Tax=Microbacterium oleivorans TaxID=273677 RepID=UPI0033C11393
MNKAWSFFWLVVAWCVGLTILAAIIAPYLWIIVLILSVGLVVFIGVKIYRALASRRTHF